MIVTFPDKRTIHISTSGFRLLAETTPSFDTNYVQSAIRNDTISFQDLLRVSQRGQIPHPIFFAPYTVIEKAIKERNRIIVRKMPKTLDINIRGEFPLEKLSTVLRDFSQKLDYLKNSGIKIVKNPIFNVIKNINDSEVAAEKLRNLLGYDLSVVKTKRSKNEVLNYIIDLLAMQNIFVSQNKASAMLQAVDRLGDFSGFIYRDSKTPFIFLAGGSEKKNEEPMGRKIFTLTLLLACFAMGKFSYVNFKSGEAPKQKSLPYDIAGAFLMPSEELEKLAFNSFDDVLLNADLFKVTPSALLVRSKTLGLISKEEANEFFRELSEFEGVKSYYQPTKNEIKAVVRYASRGYLRLAFEAYDLSEKNKIDFIRVACLNKIKKDQINSLREIVG